ncbi:MAG: cellulase family glycosylhydrolase [Candidatus Marinimicrobia bacterium]|nr:cellulase family glycosylhydrolase [Candidatus Neomarinimicrobiota bacterium]MCF7904642.1 cellulase family glycosylhydrolase [Candidatus Neomarinimicrobiota bacterium]
MAYYTTSGQNVVHRETGEIVQLRGIGLGGWLLPEGYMWGIRALDRPRQFEAAIVDLIGERNARKFWHLYRTNFVTRSDIVDMKSWGVNTIRIPLLASMLQPRDKQPDHPPFVYDQQAFSYLDDLIDWCEDIGMGVIWDLHGAPGGQNAANISDSDGEARLWTEKAVYWPQTIDLWDVITKRYADKSCIVGYDLLNEPLLARYPGVDPGLLRELYVRITDRIRETDHEGIIFVEGDDWAQDFSVLEPLDWDPHLVLAFHSYPPSSTQNGIQRWDDLRKKYDVPLWHGETGEQNPPWEIYKRSTEFLERSNIGWNWWTHKKFELSRQPWSIPRADGFNQILDYWKGQGPRPGKWQAKRWLFDQARRTNTKYCDFLPGMVRSLHPLDPGAHIKRMGIQAPVIRQQPQDLELELGYAGILQVKVHGYPLTYQWFKDGEPLHGADQFQLPLHSRPIDGVAGEYQVLISNAKGSVKSDVAVVTLQAFEGNQVSQTILPPVIDGKIDTLWHTAQKIQIDHVVSGKRDSAPDLSAWFSLTWNEDALFFLIRVFDDVLSDSASIDYMKDGIEIYLDVDNSKSPHYGQDEYQIRSVLGQAQSTVNIGSAIQDMITGQSVLKDGYIIELSLPWESMGADLAEQSFIGLDIHINDNDGATRHGKLAWWTHRDNSYQTPAVFGTIKLKK